MLLVYSMKSYKKRLYLIQVHLLLLLLFVLNSEQVIIITKKSRKHSVVKPNQPNLIILFPLNEDCSLISSPSTRVIKCMLLRILFLHSRTLVKSLEIKTCLVLHSLVLMTCTNVYLSICMFPLLHG